MTSETSPERSCPVQYFITAQSKLCGVDEKHTHTHLGHSSFHSKLSVIGDSYTQEKSTCMDTGVHS